MISDAIMLAIISRRVLKVTFGHSKDIRRLFLSGALLTPIFLVLFLTQSQAFLLVAVAIICVLANILYSWKRILETEERGWLLGLPKKSSLLVHFSSKLA